MTVEAHARFETEGVARTKASEAQLVLGVVKQELSDCFSSRGGNADLETILASVSCTADQHFNFCTFDGRRNALTKVQRLQSQTRLVSKHARQDICRERALQSNQPLSVKDVPLHCLVRILLLPRLQLFGQVGLILLSTASIGHDVELVWQACNDCVVNDASSLRMEKGGESRLIGRQCGEGGGSDALKERFGAGA